MIIGQATQAVATGLFIIVFTKALLDAIADPIHRKYPNVDLWWFGYVSFVVAGVLAYLAPVNLLGEVVTSPVLGRVMSAIVVGVAAGGGANLLNDLMSTAQGRASSISRSSGPASTAGGMMFYIKRRGW